MTYEPWLCTNHQACQVTPFSINIIKYQIHTNEKNIKYNVKLQHQLLIRRWDLEDIKVLKTSLQLIDYTI